MGRKAKYPDAEKKIQEYFDAVSESYHHPKAGEENPDNSDVKTLQALAREFGLSRIKIRKILITTGDLRYGITKEIQSLLKEGKDPETILDMSRSTINSYLPYSKNIYNLDEVSAAAERTRRYRERKKK